MRIDGEVAASLAVCDDSAIGSTSCGDNSLLGKLLCNLVRVVLVNSSGEQKVLLPAYVGGAVDVLVWVGSFVFEDLDELVEAGCDDGTEDGSKPVDPVVAVKSMVDNCWAKRTGGVEGTSSEVNSGQLCDEKGQADTYGKKSARKNLA